MKKTGRLINKLYKLIGKYNVTIYPKNIYPEETKNIVPETIYSGPIFCIHCGCKSIYEIYRDAGGTIAGGSTDYVYLCSKCNKYMSIEFEWG